MRKFFFDYLLLFVVAGLIIALDQWTKHLVRTNLDFQETWSPFAWLAPYARIVHWKNSGAAFGMFQNLGSVFMVLAIIVIVVIMYYFPRLPRQDWVSRLALCMQMAGAAGNLIDRILWQGYVTDFISLGEFPVFNVADASISIGVAVLVLGVWFKGKEQAADETPASGEQLLDQVKLLQEEQTPDHPAQGSSEEFSDAMVEGEAGNLAQEVNKPEDIKAGVDAGIEGFLGG